MPNFFKKYSETLITVATVIAAFAALVAIVDQRFNAQEKLMNQRFDAQDKHINQRFEALEQRLDDQDRRFDRLADDSAELRKLTVGISERVSRNEGAIDVIREQLQTADTPAP